MRAAFSGDGKRVVTASQDDTARIWDAESGKEIAVLKGHTGGVNTAAFSGDGKRVVTASDDKTARIWDAESGKEIAVLKGHAGTVKRGVQRRRQAGGDGLLRPHRARLGCGERQGDRRPGGRPSRQGVERGIQRRRQAGGDSVW